LRTVVVAALSLLTAVTLAMQPRFFPDDPLWSDDDRAFDASKAAEQEDSNGYDFTVNSFFAPGERRDVRAMNVNTLDEVPDSSWFTNRIGRREIPMADLVRGPDQRESTISLDGWVVSGPKGSGVQPGFRMRDPAGQLYQIEVDPPSNPEMATGAEIIGTAFYYAIGYYTVEVYLSEVDAASLVIADSSVHPARPRPRVQARRAQGGRTLPRAGQQVRARPATRQFSVPRHTFRRPERRRAP
jgi:hypothetical protein